MCLSLLRSCKSIHMTLDVYKLSCSLQPSIQMATVQLEILQAGLNSQAVGGAEKKTVRNIACASAVV